MQQSNRITYRFDSSGKKIDSFHPMMQIPQSDNQTNNDSDTSFTYESNEETVEASSYHSTVDPYYELNIEQLELLIRNADRVAQENGITHSMISNGTSDVGQAGQKNEIDNQISYELDLEEIDHNQLSTFEVETQNINENIAFENVNHQFSNQYTWSEERVESKDERKQLQPRAIRSSFNWTNGLVAVFSAVITGMLLGYLLLVQVFGSAFWQSSSAAVQSSYHSLQPDQSTIASVIEDEPIAATINIGEAHYNYQLLQAGVFSQENTRDDVIASMKQAGYTAQYTTSSNGKYYVYAAVASSALNTEPFKTAISGYELYRKELVLQLPTQLQYNGEASQLESFFQSSNRLLGMYADLISAQLEQESLSVIGASAQQAWQSHYDEWDGIAQYTMAGFVRTPYEELATQLQESLQEAQQQMLKYQEKPSAKSIWNAESAIVKAVLIQKEWFEQVN